MAKIIAEAKAKGMDPPTEKDFEEMGFTNSMMNENQFGGGDDYDEKHKDTPKFNPDDKFPFEAFLKSGEYLNLGKKRTGATDPESLLKDLMDEEDLEFK